MTGHTAGHLMVPDGDKLKEIADADRLAKAAPLLLEALKEAETALRLIENREQFWPGMESLEIHAETALKRIRSAIAAATRSET